MRSRRRPGAKAGEPGRGSAQARQRDACTEPAACSTGPRGRRAGTESCSPTQTARWSSSSSVSASVPRRRARRAHSAAQRLHVQRADDSRDRGPLARALDLPRNRSASTRSITSRPRAAARRRTSFRTGSARSASAGAPRSSSTSTARSRSTADSRSHGGLTARRRNHEPAGSAPPASRAAARAAPSGREGGSRPGPRPPSARRRARLGDLLAGVGGQAVHDDRSLRGEREQLLVELVGREVGAAALGVVLVAHADPDVGVERVGSGGGLARVVGVERRQARLELDSRRGAATRTSTPAVRPRIASERATLLPSPT